MQRVALVASAALTWLVADVRTESATHTVGPFLTGTGGHLHSVLYGLSGLRMRRSARVDAYRPALPAGWRSVWLTNVSVRDRLTLRILRGPSRRVHPRGLE
jgi:hypothetical protein